MPNKPETSATLELHGPADDVNALIVLAVTSGLCRNCEITGELPVPRRPMRAVPDFRPGDRVASAGITARHKLVADQQGTICHVRDMGARGMSLNVEWDDGVDRGSVGATHVVLVSRPDEKLEVVS